MDGISFNETDEAQNQTDMGLHNAQITSDDAIWILTSTFVIFTMQSGFGLLESGSVSSKNELNIMVKNTVDVIFGGLTFWAVGYGLVSGTSPLSNAFTSVGSFFLEENFASELAATELAKFFFQASFSTTASTIVSGAMAERTKLVSYMLFSVINTFIFVFPAHWMWSELGFLKKWGAVDFAGAGPVHVVGGSTGLIATLMLKPRLNRFIQNRAPEMSSPTNAMLGMFMLWWGWLGFNCGSTFGITGEKWKIAARSAVSTINSSIGGGMMALFLSYVNNRHTFSVPSFINGLLGSLVSITGFCGLAEPWEGFLIGAIGSFIVFYGDILLLKLKIDDPVGCIPVHCFCGIWGLLSIGLFAKPDDISNINTRYGLFYGGETYLLSVQAFSAAIIVIWSIVAATILLGLIHLSIGLRVSEHEELLGADLVEHNFKHLNTIDGQSLTYEMICQLDQLKRDSGFDVASTPEVSLQMRRLKAILKPTFSELSPNGHDRAQNQGRVEKKRRSRWPRFKKWRARIFDVVSIQ